MKAEGLVFNPLYWVVHDNWKFKTWGFSSLTGWNSSVHCHRGHVHFFMLNFDMQTQQAYSGVQTYEFSLDDTWSPRTNDPNQQQNIRIIGQPKWYFYIEEYWRRVYVQWWDHPSNKLRPKTAGWIGKKGLKYDACWNQHRYGPYRETKENFAFSLGVARTLPIEYWKNDRMTMRDNYLRQEEGEGYHLWDNKNLTYADRMIPPKEDKYVGKSHRYHDDDDGDIFFNSERNYGRPDNEYMYPTIEYQKLVQLDWERLPGLEEQNDISEDIFGDGFNIRVELPLRNKDDKIMSPFSNEGVVYPPGEYCNGFEERFPDQVLTYPDTNVSTISYSDDDQVFCTPDMYHIPPELLGKKVEWNVPEHYARYEDGLWVEQFLGGIVKGKALVTIEDNFGGREDVWVTDQQFMVTQNFEGKDQNAAS